MARTVITQADVAGGNARALETAVTPPNVDQYKDRLLKYIPAEVVALYVTTAGVIEGSADGFPKTAALWVVFFIGVVATPLFLRRVLGVSKSQQLTISTLGFLVWVFALGGPFEKIIEHQSVYGALLLPLYVFFVPVFEAKR